MVSYYEVSSHKFMFYCLARKMKRARKKKQTSLFGRWTAYSTMRVSANCIRDNRLQTSCYCCVYLVICSLLINENQLSCVLFCRSLTCLFEDTRAFKLATNHKLLSYRRENYTKAKTIITSFSLLYCNKLCWRHIII